MPAGENYEFKSLNDTRKEGSLNMFPTNTLFTFQIILYMPKKFFEEICGKKIHFLVRHLEKLFKS